MWKETVMPSFVSISLHFYGVIKKHSVTFVRVASSGLKFELSTFTKLGRCNYIEGMLGNIPLVLVTVTYHIHR